jgi:hypothetical protein
MLTQGGRPSASTSGPATKLSISGIPLLTITILLESLGVPLWRKHLI